jgi:uncharacterized cupredoxin-like copper-binding protein
MIEEVSAATPGRPGRAGRLGRLGRLAGVALVTVGVLGLAACGGDDSSSGGSGQASGTDATPVAITAKDFAFELPASVPSGVVQLTLTNQGQQPHDFQLVKIEGNHSLDEFTKAIGDNSESATIPEWIHGVGGVGTVAPGAPALSSWVKLEDGATYYYFCTESTDDNQNHSSMGMVGQLKVSGKSKATALPKTDGKVTAKEYGFEITGVKSGPQTIEFHNDGPHELHHFVAAPLAPGKTANDVLTALQSEDQSAPPPFDFEKAVSVSVIDPGVSEVVQLNLEPGKYVFVCFINDHAGGPPHAMKGMITEYEVV